MRDKSPYTQVDITDFNNLKAPTHIATRWLVNIRGINGSGKSTIPQMMMENDKDIFELTWQYSGKTKVFAVVSPLYETIFMGRYRGLQGGRTGGLDTMKSNDEIEQAVELLWDSSYNILMEGVMASTLRGAYTRLFQRMNAEHKPRQVIIYSLLPSLETCYERVQRRNGGNMTSKELMETKYRSVYNNVPLFREDGFISIAADNTNVKYEDTLKWFYETIENPQDQVDLSERSVKFIDRSWENDPFYQKKRAIKAAKKEAKKMGKNLSREDIDKIKSEFPSQSTQESDSSRSTPKPKIEQPAQVPQPIETVTLIEQPERVRPVPKEKRERVSPKKQLKAPVQVLSVTPYTNEFYVEPDENLKQYPWYPEYKAPDDSLRIYETYFDNYWHFISERMNIWYKRVVLNETPPWTDDPILQNFKFTNVIRDLDRLSIYERKNILSRIDEIQDDWSEQRKLKWKQTILLNIMIFRLWVKPDTYEIHGFIDLTDPAYRDRWESAKPTLLQRREDGISNFTAAYYVCNLRAANPDPLTKSNKTANAIALVDDWLDNIDAIYDNAIVKPHNMSEQMEYFRTLTCVGDFTAYEYACSIAEVTRYCKNHLVEWTQDNATNVGPGAKRGIEWIFKNMGGMSHYQCILYLRSIWKHELQKRGTYERFISQLPKEFNGDIDLRVIEHCLCECQKYNKAATNTGRPKETFKPKTTNVDELRV